MVRRRGDRVHRRRPIDAGQVANIFVGMRGNIKVAVKCYRFYPSSGYLPAYMVRISGELKVVRLAH